MSKLIDKVKRILFANTKEIKAVTDAAKNAAKSVAAQAAKEDIIGEVKKAVAKKHQPKKRQN